MIHFSTDKPTTFQPVSSMSLTTLDGTDIHLRRYVMLVDLESIQVRISAYLAYDDATNVVFYYEDGK